MSLRQRKNRWVYDFYPQGRKGKRIRKTLPSNIETREQAEQYLQQNSQKFHHLFKLKDRLNNISSIDSLFFAALKYFEKNEESTKYKELKNISMALVQYFKGNNLSVTDCLEPSPTIIEYYVQDRAKMVSPKKINKELFNFQKIHNYWVSQGYCEPFIYDITRFYIKDLTRKKTFSEKFFEILIERFPSQFLGEKLKFISKPPYLDKLIPDSLFTSTDNSYVIVEIQKERLDRTHAYKILEYRDKLEKHFSGSSSLPHIRMMVVVIGDICPAEREEFLKKYGIELILLPISKIEEKILTLLKFQE